MVETDLLLVYNSISGQDLRNSKYSNLINECVRLLRWRLFFDLMLKAIQLSALSCFFFKIFITYC